MGANRRLVHLIRVELALAGGDRAAARRMFGATGGIEADAWLWRTLLARLRAAAWCDDDCFRSIESDINRRGAHGLCRWGLRRATMFLMQAFESLLSRVNECED